ncbi:monocopper oxidase-like protein SKS1 [Cryptomeria japonica]|uniref:monocopper oxidase-like protein SKS1 n=1 Tax=Cryptomeria japonica TaxID=3369 RepID=UPI0027DA82DF|nr:monocopper oxidase-like protein SKS1 [Cryptomeria japonica]
MEEIFVFTLRRRLKYGKALGNPDGALINGRSPNGYSLTVNQGVDCYRGWTGWCKRVGHTKHMRSHNNIQHTIHSHHMWRLSNGV